MLRSVDGTTSGYLIWDDAIEVGTIRFAGGEAAFADLLALVE